MGIGKESSMEGFRIEKWKSGKFFALYDDNNTLVAVTVYRRGALEIKRRLQDLKSMVVEVAEHGSTERAFPRDQDRQI